MQESKQIKVQNTAISNTKQNYIRITNKVRASDELSIKKTNIFYPKQYCINKSAPVPAPEKINKQIIRHTITGLAQVDTWLYKFSAQSDTLIGAFPKTNNAGRVDVLQHGNWRKREKVCFRKYMNRWFKQQSGKKVIQTYFATLQRYQGKIKCYLRAETCMSIMNDTIGSHMRCSNLINTTTAVSCICHYI